MNHQLLAIHKTFVRCLGCGRAWRIDERFADPRNQQYLLSHVYDHEPIHRRTPAELGWGDGEERSEP